eukprot:Nk52_evm4s316 gene=Nk52_evmTU4s316
MRSSFIVLIALSTFVLGTMLANAHVPAGHAVKQPNDPDLPLTHTGDESNNCHFLNGSHVCSFTCRGFSHVNFQRFGAPEFQNLCRQARQNKLGVEESEQESEELNLRDPAYYKRDVCLVRSLTVGGLDKAPYAIDMTCNLKGARFLRGHDYCRTFCLKAWETTALVGGIMQGFRLKLTSFDPETKDCNCDYAHMVGIKSRL